MSLLGYDSCLRSQENANVLDTDQQYAESFHVNRNSFYSSVSALASFLNGTEITTKNNENKIIGRYSKEMKKAQSETHTGWTRAKEMCVGHAFHVAILGLIPCISSSPQTPLEMAPYSGVSPKHCQGWLKNKQKKRKREKKHIGE